MSVQDAEATYSKAAKAELAADYDLAFRNYIRATELYLHHSRAATSSDRLKTQCKTNASKALERAEKLKAFSNQARQGGRDVRLTTVSINYFSEVEQGYVIQRGANVNGLQFPPYRLASSISDTDAYDDQDGQPALSSAQQSASPVWRRPPTRPSTAPLLPSEILQHVVSDCSLCASISACLEHSRRFNSKLITSILQRYPAENGRYDLRLLFNGLWRRIVIDDKLPYEPENGTPLCMSCQRTDVLWPSLVEKGFMKLMGGYDFPGSNSCIDLHALIGWIPEHIDIRSSNFERENTWQRVHTGFLHGHCLVTLGTGVHIDSRHAELKLLAEHCYAVIDLQEAPEGHRTVTLLDSRTLSSIDGNDQDNSSRTLQLSWDEILDLFDGVYLSWDPGLWKNTLTFHGMWRESVKAPILRLNFDLAHDEEIWILLTRHVTNVRTPGNFISLNVQLEEDTEEGSGTTFSAAISPKGIYTNSTHVLAKSRLPSEHSSGTLSIIPQIDDLPADTGFTLSVYAPRAGLSWIENPEKAPYMMKLEGTLTSKNSGGNARYPTFMLNPQYHLQLRPARREKTADVTLVMQTTREVPVNIAVVWSQGERTFDLSRKELAACAGAYTYGLARLRHRLPVGDYTVILSAFEPRHTGPFTLTVDSSLPCELTPIAQEGAGMYCKLIGGKWRSGTTAAGGPSFGNYSNNPVFLIDVAAANQLKIRLQATRPDDVHSINITVFPAGSLEQHVATSGPYDDAVSGVATPLFSVKPGKYWVVPSTYRAGLEAAFQMLVYSTGSGFTVVGPQTDGAG